MDVDNEKARSDKIKLPIFLNAFWFFFIILQILYLVVQFQKSASIFVSLAVHFAYNQKVVICIE